ncbi:unnamed protein product [Coffea canephora]|uniref:DH200=94 genomic scaffold, scaffold_518 n=1 Tax=Coffea canephora TaxID=49390 RepID=A0A068VIJ2_COFCA|nr:unnamed protein product [Coffea canephora]
MARLLRNASSLGCSLFLQPLSQTYRKGLLGASTQLSYFSSKRYKKIQVRCQRKIWHSSRQCIISLHHLEKVLSCGLAALPLSNKFQLCLQVILLNWILQTTMGLAEDIISWAALDTALSSSFQS